MKNINQIIASLNVARSNDCSKEKSEEIKKIINDLLPHKKQEKALEIIKSKEISISWFKTATTLEEYNGIWQEPYRLTQEEYNLLKEVLLW